MPEAVQSRVLPLPPGPSQPFGVNPFTFHRHRLQTFSRIAHDYGDISSFRLGPVRLAIMNHPDLVREVLVTHDDWFHKGRGVNELKRILGMGLLTSEGDFHRRQRRIIQPIFNHDKIAGYGADMVALATQARERWHDGDQLDIAREMMRLTLAVVGKTLFGVDVEGAASDVGHSLETMMRWTMNLISPYGFILDRLPLPGHRHFQEGLAKLNAILEAMILERRQKTGQGDLLARMLAAQDVEGDGKGMNDRQLRDEAMTLFLAGHETTAQALSFTWYLLAQHPQVEARLHDELGRVLGDRAATAEDYGKLSYTRKVLSESMRLISARVDHRPRHPAGHRAARLPHSQGHVRRHQPLHQPPRPALLPRPGALRSRALHPRGHRRAPALRLLSVRRRLARVHRRRLRHDGGDAALGHPRPALEVPAGAGFQAGARAADHPAAEARHRRAGAAQGVSLREEPIEEGEKALDVLPHRRMSRRQSREQLAKRLRFQVEGVERPEAVAEAQEGIEQPRRRFGKHSGADVRNLQRGVVEELPVPAGALDRETSQHRRDVPEQPLASEVEVVKNLRHPIDHEEVGGSGQPLLAVRGLPGEALQIAQVAAHFSRESRDDGRTLRRHPGSASPRQPARRENAAGPIPAGRDRP
jgi:cytochrome P450